MRNPDHQGAYGKAWRMEIPEDSPTLAAWLIYAPGQHAAWAHYMLAILDLSDRDDMPPAYKDTPDVRWEVGVFALEDGITGKPQPQPDGSNISFITPQNVRVQVPDHPAEKMEALGDVLVRGALDGMARLEPFGMVGPLWEEWREIVLSTLEHPYHYGEG